MPNGHDQYQGLPPGMTFEAACKSLPTDERLVFESYCEGRPDLRTVCDQLNLTNGETYAVFKRALDRLWGRVYALANLGAEPVCDAPYRVNERTASSYFSMRSDRRTNASIQYFLGDDCGFQHC